MLSKCEAIRYRSARARNLRHISRFGRLRTADLRR